MRFFVLVVNGQPESTYRSKAAASKWNSRVYGGAAEVREVEGEEALDKLFNRPAQGV